MKNTLRKTSFTPARPAETAQSPRLDDASAYGSLHRTVVEQIGRKIVGGEFAPGEVLPNADDSSAMLGVSRTVLREAIKVLAGKGLVASRPKTGTRIRPRSEWNFLDPDVLAWRYGGNPSEQDVNDLFELRRGIEPMAAGLAAMNAAPEQIAEIEQVLEDMKKAGDDGAAFEGPDLAFHQMILRMTGNELIASLGALIETALMISFRLSDRNPDGHQHSLPLHREVAQKIAAGDGLGAQRAITALIDGAEQDVRRGLAYPENTE